MLTKDDVERLANEERDRFRRFAPEQNEPQFALILGRLYEEWDSYNADCFHGVLKPTHITCGQVPPRGWGFFSTATDWGGQSQITLKQSLVWGTNKAVVNLWPAIGTVRFILEVLFHEIVHEWQHEIAEKPEHRYGGHGRLFAAKCNDTGAVLGLPRVVAKPRKNSKDSPSCAYWPHNVRPDGYYCADVDIDRLFERAKPKHVQEIVEIFRNLLAMLEDGSVNEVKRIIREEIARAEGRDGKCLR